MCMYTEREGVDGVRQRERASERRGGRGGEREREEGREREGERGEGGRESER